MLTAVVVCALLLRRTQARLPLGGWQKLGIGIGAFCGAMLGAKLPFVLADWEGMRSGAVWFSHGKTIIFGLVGGYFGVVVAKWVLEIRVKTGDSFAVPVAVAVATGRLACFWGGCCYGKVTAVPWGVVFSHQEMPRHPTQLYESVFHLSAAAILYWLGKRGLLQGQLFKLYIVAYLAYRFASEWIRPEPVWWLGLTVYQWAALSLAPIFVWIWISDVRRTSSQAE